MGQPVVTVAAGGVPVVDVGVAPVTYATFDAASVTAVTLSGGNLVATNTGTTSLDQGARVATASGKTTGKYYFEMTMTHVPLQGSSMSSGIGTTAATYTGLGTNGAAGAACYWLGGAIYATGNTAMGIGGRASGETMGVAVDLDNRKVFFRVAPVGNWNGLAIGSQNPVGPVGGVTVPAGTIVPLCTFGGPGGTINHVLTANFGASAFVGAVPAGFTAGWPDVAAAAATSVFGTPVTEAANGYGLRVTKAANGYGTPVVYETIGVAPPVAWATLNGAVSPAVVVSNGGLTVTHTTQTSSLGAASASFKATGKYYFEVVQQVTTHAGNGFGILLSTGTFAQAATGTNSVEIADGGGSTTTIIWANNVSTGKNLGAYVLTDVFKFAFNLDIRRAWICRNNGLWNATAGDDPATAVGGVVIAAGSFSPHVVFGTGGPGTETDAFTFNLGQSAFVGAVPAGFTAGWPA